ncbi:MAG TPA: glycosyltransferase [Thermoanaerobaculaceae bacterium]|nr:glycosyltransferase [Thermoanaerobaculaceae bacterium]
MTAPRIRRALGWLPHPARFLRKTRRWRAQRRALPAYRDALARGELLAEAGPLPPRGLISVAMPVFRVREAHLRAAIASVRAQTWTDWELVVVDDASPDAHVARVFAEAAADPRVRVVRRATTGGISRASDDAVAHARADFVAFLDHDDELHPRALEMAARALASHPDTDWLFSDEDKLDEDGRHSQPMLKPGWSRHLLLGFNLVSHLRVVRRATIGHVGGHRPEYDGAQDYDLALRVLAAGGSFRHLPGPLYHWREVRGSMARFGSAKPQANARALAALREHARGFPRGGAVSAGVLVQPANVFRVRRAADDGLSIAVAAREAATFGRTEPGRRRARHLPLEDRSPGALVAAARTCDDDVVLTPPEAGLAARDVEELLALLQVPGTAAAAGCLATGNTVVSSGWVVNEEGLAVDPWRGLALPDPGYLNLALLPGRRTLPPPCGWAAWRADLLEAWDSAPDAEDRWRLAVGWARLGREVVATPDATVEWEGSPVEPPLTPVPGDLPRTPMDRLARFGLLP